MFNIGSKTKIDNAPLNQVEELMQFTGFGQRIRQIIDLDHGSKNGKRPIKDKDNNWEDPPGNKTGWEDGLPPGQAKKPGWDTQHKYKYMETNYAVDMLSPTEDILLSYGENSQIQRFTYGLEVLSMHFQSI